ncbi:MAG TPA: TldD/PmbA family protein [bacterium]|jgi:TldD protein
MAETVTTGSDLQERMQDAIKAGADAQEIEIRIEDNENTTIAYLKDDLESLDRGVNAGGCVRALVDGSWGFTSFNSLHNLQDRVHDAIKMAKAVGPGKAVIPDQAPIQDSVSVDLKNDPRDIPVSETIKLIESYNRIMSESEGIVTTSSSYRHFHYKRYFMNKSGTYIEQEKMRATVVLLAMALDANGMRHDAFDYAYSLEDYDIVFGHDNLAKDVARRAVEIANAPKIKGGSYTVIVDPRLSGTFIHEAFGHLSEADFVYENPDWQNILTMGRKLGQDFLNVTDGGTIPSEGGTMNYDDEGTPTRVTKLITDGVLTGRLHSRETAKALGEEVTGNARAVSYRFPPIVRMTNTSIEPGPHKLEDMFKDVEYGIYAVGAHGGQTALEAFTFGAAEGFEIVNGEIGKRLRNVSISGNLFSTLENIDMVSDDRMYESVGGCGKGEQAPLPVGTGGPHIRIQNCIVGGES